MYVCMYVSDDDDLLDGEPAMLSLEQKLSDLRVSQFNYLQDLDEDDLGIPTGMATCLVLLLVVVVVLVQY